MATHWQDVRAPAQPIVTDRTQPTTRRTAQRTARSPRVTFGTRVDVAAMIAEQTDLRFAGSDRLRPDSCPMH